MGQFMKLHKSIQDIHGHLANIDDPPFDKIDFEWEGIHFQAKSHAEAGQHGRIQLRANLGRLYYTIEDQAQRAMAIERLYATNRGIDGAYHIDAKGNVLFESVTTTDTRMTGTDLMGALTLILLEAETHLRALRTHLAPPEPVAHST